MFVNYTRPGNISQWSLILYSLSGNCDETFERKSFRPMIKHGFKRTVCTCTQVHGICRRCNRRHHPKNTDGDYDMRGDNSFPTWSICKICFLFYMKRISWSYLALSLSLSPSLSFSLSPILLNSKVTLSSSCEVVVSNVPPAPEKFSFCEKGAVKFVHFFALSCSTVVVAWSSLK